MSNATSIEVPAHKTTLCEKKPIPPNGSNHHFAAAEHCELAAKHHREAATYCDSGSHAAAGYHSSIAHGHTIYAYEHSEDAIKLHTDKHDPLNNHE
jgi:hypothetical protein